MPAGPEVRKFADGWVQAWNSHDLDVIMSYYASEVVLTSPVAAKLFDESGIVAGKEQLRGYFKPGLEAYPKLAFELLDVMWGVSSMILYYSNQAGTRYQRPVSSWSSIHSKKSSEWWQIMVPETSRGGP